MSAQAVTLAESFVSPGPKDFVFNPIFGDGTFLTKPMAIVIIGTLAVGGILFASARRASVVPGRLQFAGESLYGFVRNDIAGDTLGSAAPKFVPYLATLFSFLVTLNLAGIIPFFQLPATAKIGITLFPALCSWVLFNIVGIKRQGFGGYFKAMCLPPGVPKPIYLLIAPLEFLSTVLIRPITLTLRLTLNMFAGHLVLLVCIVGGEYMLLHGSLGLKFLSPVGFIFAIALTFFEGFIQILQAYVFTLLSALYVAGALENDH